MSFDILVVTCRVTKFLPKLIDCYFLWKKLNFYFLFSPIFGYCRASGRVMTALSRFEPNERGERWYGDNSTVALTRLCACDVVQNKYTHWPTFTKYLARSVTDQSQLRLLPLTTNCHVALAHNTVVLYLSTCCIYSAPTHVSRVVIRQSRGTVSGSDESLQGKALLYFTTPPCPAV